jgi:hypothetical protein
MNIELIRAPGEGFLRQILQNVRQPDRQRLEKTPWGAVGLVQGRLIHLYTALDLAEKASRVECALVLGNCPQHTQMLAIFGQQAAVKEAVDKIRRHFGKTDSG